jgi:hypothetical protein
MAEDRTRERLDDTQDPEPFLAPRRQPFTHGDLPGRPNYNPEEGEGGTSEIWAVLGGLSIAGLVIFGLGWLIAA